MKSKDEAAPSGKEKDNPVGFNYAVFKAWVRREIALAAVGHTVEEREKENP